MRESVLIRADADICEKRETLDVAVLIRRVLGHLGGLFHGVFTDDLHNREISPKPHGPPGKSYTSPSPFPYPMAWTVVVVPPLQCLREPFLRAG